MKKDNKNENLGVADVHWDLTHLYTGIEDESVEKDMQECRSLARNINKKYAGRISNIGKDELFSVTEEMEKVSIIVGKLSTFAYLNFATQVSSPEAGAFLQKITEFGSEIEKELVFFDLEWADLSDEKAKELLQDDTLKHYRHHLQSLRRYRPHLLSHEKEELLIERSPVGVLS